MYDILQKYRSICVLLVLIFSFGFFINSQAASSLGSRFKGYILLQVEEHGEAWYVIPAEQKRVYMKDGNTAYQIMRYVSLGIKDSDLAKIPVGIEARFNDLDTDQDGLSDRLEEGLGTNLNDADSDDDGFSDGQEIINNYNPLNKQRLIYDNSLVNRLKGYILLQTERQGQAWYLNPKDGKRYYMKDGAAAYQIMRFLSLGITNNNLKLISTSTRNFEGVVTPPNNNQNNNNNNSTSTPPGGNGNNGNSGGGGGGGGGGSNPPPVDNDFDNDGYDALVSGGTDCNDDNANIHPGASEICGNNIDEDCSGADLQCASSCIDTDSDGYGSPASNTCQYSALDCNNNNSAIYPGATEICGNGVDEDCSGADLAYVPPPDYDLDNDGYNSIIYSSGTDCNDDNANIHPGAIEICGNNIDEDCSGADLQCQSVGPLLLNLTLDNNYQDATGNNTVTCVGGFCPTPVNDGQRSAYSFDGTDCLDLGINNILDLTDNTLTLTAWIKTSNTASSQYILGKAGSTNSTRKYGMLLHAGGVFGTYTNNYDEDSTSFTVPLNTWTHVAMTWNGSTKTAYVNGQVVGSWAGTAITDDNVSPLLGCRFSGTSTAYRFNGSMDDVRIYDNVLSAAELTALYDSQNQGSITPCADADGDGYQAASCGGDDCNDNNPGINPSEAEICGNSIDEDCSGADLQCSYDADSDGYNAVQYGGNDCNDNNSNINPGAVEICGNGVDEDCSGADLQCQGGGGGNASINSISDATLNNGQSVTIFGSGFGTNGNTPTQWENFDDGLAQNMDLTTNPGMYDPDVSSIEKHSGNYSMRTRLGDPNIEAPNSAARNGYGIYWFPQAMQGGEKAYISFWERWDWGVWYCGAGGQSRASYQIKNFRVGSDSHATNPPDFPQNNQSDCDGYGAPDFFPRNYVTHIDGSGHAVDTDYYGRMFEPEFGHLHQQWMLFEIEFKQSNNGQSDGSYEMWLTRNGQTRKIINYQNINTHQSGDPGFNKLTLGNWIDSGGRSATLYFDDLFVDFSWQRIAIGNNSNWDQSSKREIQPYTVWSDSSISFNANLNAFNSGEQLYLFVFDVNGDPSIAYPIMRN